MGAITWLASYPKSGNTWARVFIENYCSERDTPADINKLSIRNAAQRMLFDRFGALEPSELTDEEVQALRPELYRAIAAESPAHVFLKVHDAFGANGDGLPVFPPEITQAVIYIVRHPCEVAVSLAFHEGITMDAAVAAMCDEERVISESTGQCRQRVRSWTGHVRSWVDESGLPVTVVRFEDILADAPAAFRAVLAAARVAVDEERLLRAVEHSTFERLQAQERAAGFVERAPRSTAPFFRQGRSGNWREHLTAAHVARLVEEHGDTMRRFRYLTDRSEAV